MKKSIKFLLLALIFVVATTSLAACGGKTTSSTDEKVYVVGTDAAYPPMEKQEGDKIVGFDIDVIKEVAKEAGIKIEIKHTGWDGLFEGIDNGSVDLGISSITITDERKELYDFSDPYFEASQIIMVEKDSGVKTLNDLKGKKIGVQTATTGDIVVQETFGKTYSGLRGYDGTPEAVDDLVLGRVDAVVADIVVLQAYLDQLNNDNFKLIKDPAFEPEFYGIMFKKGVDKELQEKINDALKKVKESGKYDEIYKQYFEK